MILYFLSANFYKKKRINLKNLFSSKRSIPSRLAARFRRDRPVLPNQTLHSSQLVQTSAIQAQLGRDATQHRVARQPTLVTHEVSLSNQS